jgi:hypothetical protein
MTESDDEAGDRLSSEQIQLLFADIVCHHGAEFHSLAWFPTVSDTSDAGSAAPCRKQEAGRPAGHLWQEEECQGGPRAADGQGFGCQRRQIRQEEGGRMICDRFQQHANFALRFVRCGHRAMMTTAPARGRRTSRQAATRRTKTRRRGSRAATATATATALRRKGLLGRLALQGPRAASQCRRKLRSPRRGNRSFLV